MPRYRHFVSEMVKVVKPAGNQKSGKQDRLQNGQFGGKTDETKRDKINTKDFKKAKEKLMKVKGTPVYLINIAVYLCSCIFRAKYQDWGRS